MCAVSVEELADFSRKHAPDRVFHLYGAGHRIGFFYMTQATSTLGWPGLLDFTRLDREALRHLPTLVQASYGKEGYLPRLRDESSKVSVSIVLEPSHDLLEFKLGRESEYEKYRQVIQESSNISFARYDVSFLAGDATVSFTFTAENPVWSAEGDNELALRLDRTAGWTTELLDWVLEHHANGHEILASVPTVKLAHDLKRLAAL